MARLATLGFEENTNTAGVEFTSSAGSPVIQNTTARSGGLAGQITSLASGVEQSWTYQYAAANISTDTYFRFYFNVSAYPNATTIIFCLKDSTANDSCDMRFDSAGGLGIFDNSGSMVGSSTTIPLNTWVRIEVRYFNTSGICEFKVDGTVIATESGGATSTIRDLILGGNVNSGTSTAGTWYFDDVAINSTAAGGTQTGYPGPGRVIVLRPNAAGDNNTFATQTGGTAGAANNFTRVNEVPPDDVTTFNGDITSGDIDDFNIDNTPAALNASSTINCVQVNVRFRASVASAEAIYKSRIKKAAAGTVTSSAALTPNATTWKTNTNAVPNVPQITLYLDPDGIAWTKATLDTTQIGYTISTTGTNRADISAIWLTVDFVPGPVGIDVSPGNNSFNLFANKAVNRSSSF